MVDVQLLLRVIKVRLANQLDPTDCVYLALCVEINLVEDECRDVCYNLQVVIQIAERPLRARQRMYAILRQGPGVFRL